MMISILHYLLIGTILTMIVDIVTWYARRSGIIVPLNSEWTWSTRLVAILIWPLGLIYLVVGIAIGITNKNKNK
jgi:hypothetical protein